MKTMKHITFLITALMVFVACTTNHNHVISGPDEVVKPETQYLVMRQHIPEDIINSPMRDSFAYISGWYVDTISCWEDPVHAVIYENIPNGGWFEILYYLKENVIVTGNMTIYMDPDHKRIMTIDPRKYMNYNKKLFDAEKAARHSETNLVQFDMYNDTCTFWFSAKQHERGFWFHPPNPIAYFKGQLYSECMTTDKKSNWDDAQCLGKGTFRDVVINGVQQCENTPPDKKD